MTTLNTIRNLSNLYVQDLPISVASNTTLTIGTGKCRDDSDSYDMVSEAAITLNAAVAGANGIDTGSFAASKMYYIYLIMDTSGAKSIAALMSLSLTAPVLPTGYNKKRWIGVAASDSSTHFILLHQSGKDKSRVYSYDEPVSAIAAGTEATFTAVSLAEKIPAISNTRFTALADFVPNAADDAAYIRAGGSAATNGKVIYGCVASKKSSAELDLVAILVTSAPSISYKVTASGSLNLLLNSFEVYL